MRRRRWRRRSCYLFYIQGGRGELAWVEERRHHWKCLAFIPLLPSSSAASKNPSPPFPLPLGLNWGQIGSAAVGLESSKCLPLSLSLSPLPLSKSQSQKSRDRAAETADAKGNTFNVNLTFFRHPVNCRRRWFDICYSRENRERSAPSFEKKKV